MQVWSRHCRRSGPAGQHCGHRLPPQGAETAVWIGWGLGPAWHRSMATQCNRPAPTVVSSCLVKGRQGGGLAGPAAGRPVERRGQGGAAAGAGAGGREGCGGGGRGGGGRGGAQQGRGGGGVAAPPPPGSPCLRCCSLHTHLTAWCNTCLFALEWTIVTMFSTHVTTYHHLISQAGWNRCNLSAIPTAFLCAHETLSMAE